MRSLIVNELYYKIASENLGIPKHIFFSGYKSSNVKRREKHI